ncbi:ATPase [Alicyclobacillus sp. SP_1]|uniref:ATPase n=1 Tax=Alicyclobacillus sp. SP_1 TaxID=2942475 RepID=UPI00215821B4|nr:ATPase [Alicyclobacillus sp. SP_1]
MPHFFLVEGPLGAGKTLTASLLAHYWRQRSGASVQLFANYDLLHATPLDAVDRWLEVAEARGSICIWDEAQLQFDRRLWSRNTFITQIFNMTRKLRAVHVFVNPVGMNLDSRILDLVEVLIHVTKYPSGAMGLDLYEFQDKRWGPYGRRLTRLSLPAYKVRKVQRLALYDTDQVLYPFPSPKTEVEQTKLLKAIVQAQQEASAKEKHQEGTRDGWVHQTTHYLARTLAEEEDDEASGEPSLSFS